MSYSGSGYNYGSISRPPVPHNQVTQGSSIPYGKVDLRKNGGAGGGLWASMTGSPIAWTGGFLMFCAIISMAVWVTIDSLGGSTINIVDVEEGVDSYTFGSKPHIIYILADDLGWNSIGYEDFDLSFTTPTLTTLAQEGIIMNSFYAQEVCTPARASLLTGRLPLTVGMQYSMVQTAMPWGLDLAETTLAEVLRDDNYSTHMLGKWHLGHYSPRLLPTARGFETFTGFLNGESYYWSKRNPDHTTFHDLMYSTEDCYIPYDADDMHDYSTFFYRDKAKQLIREHNSTDKSLFLFLSFQAVHDPFVDIGIHENGIPKEYLDEDMYSQIISSVKGRKRRQYAMSLTLMDDAIGEIVEQLDTSGMLDNSVIIFASDNGGCHGAGGKNGPLRGTKGSLFEGGTKVDSFLWSKMLPKKSQGKLYDNLFHISDWFPTILAITGTTYTPETGHELDGVNHIPAMLYGHSTPREYLLYNWYYNVDYYYFDMWINGSFAIRNSQYKLMHTFNSSTYGVWYQPEETLDDDDAITTENRCTASFNNDGGFLFWLFDLENDPYETTNLYDLDEYHDTKEELYAELFKYQNKSYEMTYDFTANRKSFQVWKEHGNYMVPYVNMKDLEKAKGTYPEDCYVAAMDETATIPSAAPSMKSLPTLENVFPVPSPTPPPTKHSDDETVEPTMPPYGDPTDEPTNAGERSSPSFDPSAAPSSPKTPTIHPTLNKPTEDPTGTLTTPTLTQPTTTTVVTTVTTSSPTTAAAPTPAPNSRPISVHTSSPTSSSVSTPTATSPTSVTTPTSVTIPTSVTTPTAVTTPTTVTTPTSVTIPTTVTTPTAITTPTVSLPSALTPTAAVPTKAASTPTVLPNALPLLSQSSVSVPASSSSSSSASGASGSSLLSPPTNSLNSAFSSDSSSSRSNLRSQSDPAETQDSSG